MASPASAFLKVFALIAAVIALTAVAIFAVLTITGPAETFQPGYVLQYTYGPAFAQTAAQNAADVQNVRIMGLVQAGFAGQAFMATTVARSQAGGPPDLRLLLNGNPLAVYAGAYNPHDIGAWVASKVSGLRFSA